MTSSNEMTARIESKIDRSMTDSIGLVRAGAGYALMPSSVAEALELAKILATAKGMIPGHLYNNPGACAAVVFQAIQWGMNPFSLAQSSFVVREGAPPAYMAQAIAAAVNGNPRLKERLRLFYAGSGDDMICTVTGKFKGESQPHEYESPRIRDISPKNSPLWKVDARRQLGYFAQRAWARLYASDILMGVYDADEITPEMLSKDVTPKIDPFAGEGPRKLTGSESSPAPATAEAVESLTPASASSNASDGADQSDVAGASQRPLVDAPAPSSEDIARAVGKDAYTAGIDESDNPYQANSPEWLAWIEGFHEAAK